MVIVRCPHGCERDMIYMNALEDGYGSFRCPKCRKLTRAHVFKDELKRMDDIRRSQEMLDA